MESARMIRPRRCATKPVRTLTTPRDARDAQGGDSPSGPWRPRKNYTVKSDNPRMARYEQVQTRIRATPAVASRDYVVVLRLIVSLAWIPLEAFAQVPCVPGLTCPPPPPNPPPTVRLTSTSSWATVYATLSLPADAFA